MTRAFGTGTRFQRACGTWIRRARLKGYPGVGSPLGALTCTVILR